MTERELHRRAEKEARSVRAAEDGADQSARRRGGTGTRDRCPAARGPGRGRDRGGTAPGDAVREGRRGMSRRSFTLLLLGQISSLTGNLTLKFALSMYVLERTGSASVFAGLLALSMLPTVLLSPLGGLLADRADRRKVMVALDLLSGLAVLCAGLALLPSAAAFVPGVGRVPAFVILVVSFSIAQAACSAFSVCAITRIQSLTPEHLTGKVMSFVYTLSMCAQPLGQIIYGALFDALPPVWVLAPSAVLVLVCGCIYGKNRACG